MSDSESETNLWSPTVPSPDKQIWRYIDFRQLVSILDRKALWFNRADRFSDPLEGSFPRANVETRSLRYEDTEIPQTALDELSEFFKLWRKVSYVNCWHRNPYESAAMWDLYSSQGQGIAIQSTVARFRDAIECGDGSQLHFRGATSEGESEYHIGKVQYIDYDKQLAPENRPYALLFHKRRSYASEKEFRAMFDQPPITERRGEEDNIINVKEDPDMDPGVYVDIDVDTLVETLYVSPTARDTFHDLVGNVISEYGFDFDPVRSNLDEDPVF